MVKFCMWQVELSDFPVSECQRRWPDCADAQAGLRLCYSHFIKSGSLAAWPIWYFKNQIARNLDRVIVCIVFQMHFACFI